MVPQLTPDKARDILVDADCNWDVLDAAAIRRADDAAWFLLRHHLTQIADGLVDPFSGLDALESEVRWRYLSRMTSGNYVGESHGYHRLYGLYDCYFDLIARPHQVSFDRLRGEEALAAWKCAVILEARRWLEEHFEPSQPPE